MPNVRVSELTAATSPDGSELTPIVQAGVTKKMSLSQLESVLIAISQRGVINGVAALDVDGDVIDAAGTKVSGASAGHPSLATHETLGLTAQTTLDVHTNDPNLHTAAGPGAVGTTELADGAVTTPKIADAAVIGQHITDASVSAQKIGAAVGANGNALIYDSTELSGLATHDFNLDYVRQDVINVKGDLLMGDANNTVVRKSVGADGTILHAQSTLSGGAQWKQADHGVLTGLDDNDHPQYRLAATAIDHGALTGLGDDDHTQYLRKAVATTKGDIFAATGSGAVSRQAVGNNDSVLAADSTMANGVTWKHLFTTLGAQRGLTSAAAAVAPKESTTSTSYTNLATIGPDVTITVAVASAVLVNFGAWIYLPFQAGSINAFCSVERLSGNVANDGWAAVLHRDGRISGGNVDNYYDAALGVRATSSVIFNVAAGTYTFRMKYRQVGLNVLSASFGDRRIDVLVF